MTIGYIISTLRRCGPVNQLYYMIKYLDRSKYTPIIITLSKEGENSIIDKFYELNIKIITINLSRFKGIFSLNSVLEKIIHDNNIDIVHSQGIRADGVNAKLKNIKHKVCSIRNYAFEDYVMKFGAFTGTIMAFLHLNYIRKIKHKESCSYFIAEKLLSNHKIKTDVIEDGIDTDRFTAATEDVKDSIKKKLSIPFDRKIIVFTGSMIKRKDPVTLAKGFLAFQKTHDGYSLFMVGNGKLLKKLKANFNDKSIIFTGEVANVDEYLKIADYFVLPSLSEGLPNAALEALSSGLPCILSDIKPHKVFTNAANYKGVIYFKAGSYGDLLKGFETIITGDKKQTASNNRNLILEKYSAKLMADKYTALYNNII